MQREEDLLRRGFQSSSTTDHKLVLTKRSFGREAQGMHRTLQVMTIEVKTKNVHWRRHHSVAENPAPHKHIPGVHFVGLKRNTNGISRQRSSPYSSVYQHVELTSGVALIRVVARLLTAVEAHLCSLRVSLRLCQHADRRTASKEACQMRAREAVQSVQGVWRVKHLSARPAARSVQRVWRQQHLSAWSDPQSVQGVWRGKHLPARAAAQ